MQQIGDARKSRAVEFFDFVIHGLDTVVLVLSSGKRNTQELTSEEEAETG